MILKKLCYNICEIYQALLGLEIMKSNYGKYYTHQTACAIALMFCSGTVLQAFLLANGFSEQQVYYYTAMTQLVQVFVMLGSIFFSNQIQNTIKTVGILTLAPLLLFATQFLVMFFAGRNVQTSVVSFFIVSAIVYCFMGIKAIQEYRMPYQILPMEDYGRVCGVSAAIGKFFCLAVSVLYSALVVIVDYNTINICFFVAASIGVIVASLSCFALKNNGLQSIREKAVNNANKYRAFKNKHTYILLLPNFFRGIATGVISALSVIGMSKGLVNTQTSTYLNVVIQIALLLANMFFAFACTRRFSVRKIMLISALLMAIFMPLSIARENSYEFIVGYLFVQFFCLLVDTSIPVLVTEFIPYEEMGTFTSIRMSSFMFGTFVILLFMDKLLALMGSIPLMILGGATQVCCVLAYYFVARFTAKRKKIEENG